MPSPASTMTDAPYQTTAPAGRPWRKTATYWVPALAGYWGLLFFSTHTQQIEAIVETGIFDYDKLLHAGAYFVLMTLVLIAGRRVGVASTWRGRLIAAAVVIAYGALDELTQPYVGRHCSLYDWIADSLGAALAVTLDQLRHWRTKSE